MAITKLMHMKESKKGNKATHLKNAIHYIMRPEKTDNGRWIGGTCDLSNPYQTMMETKRRFGKEWGRQGYHFVLSISPDDDGDERKVYEFTREFVERFFQDRYEVVFAVHNDTDILHSHIVFNSIDRVEGRKYHYADGDWERSIQPLVNEISKKYNLRMLDLDEVKKKRKEKAGEKNEIRQAPCGDKEQIKRDIDQAIVDSADYFDFIRHLTTGKGYQIRRGISKIHGVYLALTAPGAKRAVRSYQLGGKYSVDAITERLLVREEKRTVLESPELKIRNRSPAIRSAVLTASEFKSDINIDERESDNRVEANTEEIVSEKEVTEDVRKALTLEKRQEIRRTVLPKSVYTSWEHLSEYQKRTLRRMLQAREAYRPGYRRNRISTANRTDVVRIGELQRQFLFLYQNGIKSESQLYAYQEQLKKQRREVRKRRRQVYKKYSPYMEQIKKMEQGSYLMPFIPEELKNVYEGYRKDMGEVKEESKKTYIKEREVSWIIQSIAEEQRRKEKEWGKRR